MTEPVICPNCHTEMEPGGVTKSKVMEYTEYTCPNGCSPWSEGKPLPGHEPRPVVPRVKAEAERLADDLLEELVKDEEVLEEVVLDKDLEGSVEEVTEMEDGDV